LIEAQGKAERNAPKGNCHATPQKKAKIVATIGFTTFNHARRVRVVIVLELEKGVVNAGVQKNGSLGELRIMTKVAFKSVNAVVVAAMIEKAAHQPVLRIEGIESYARSVNKEHALETFDVVVGIDSRQNLRFEDNAATTGALRKRAGTQTTQSEKKGFDLCHGFFMFSIFNLSPAFQFRYKQFMQPQLHWIESRLRPNTKVALWQWPNTYKTALPPRGYVWLIHGFGEYALRYQELASYLCEIGFDVLALDLPGHGKTRREGGRAQLESFPDMLSEIRRCYEYWHLEGPQAKAGAHQKKNYLVAHSMGSLLAINHLVSEWKHEELVPAFERVFLSSPLLELRLPVPTWKKKLAYTLEKASPDLKLGNELQGDQLSRDAVVIYDHSVDKEMLSYATPRFFTSMEDNTARIRNKAGLIEIPTCIVLGEADPIVNTKAVEIFFEKIGTHKKLIKFPDNRHENFNELGRRDVYKECAQWIL
jgi:lysophospholipase